MEQYPLPIQERVKEVISSLNEFIREEEVEVNSHHNKKVSRSKWLTDLSYSKAAKGSAI